MGSVSSTVKKEEEDKEKEEEEEGVVESSLWYLSVPSFNQFVSSPQKYHPPRAPCRGDLRIRTSGNSQAMGRRDYTVGLGG